MIPYLFIIVFYLFSCLSSGKTANEILRDEDSQLSKNCLQNDSRTSEVMKKNQSQDIVRDVCAPGERFYSDCKPCDTFCSDQEPRNCSTPSSKAISCKSGCACAPGFRRTLQGACVQPMLCIANNTGPQNITGPTNVTTTTAPTTGNLTCANVRCLVGKCIMVNEIPMCMSTPVCQSLVEQWYQCMPCETLCTENNEVITRMCSPCSAGCGCKSGYIRRTTGECILPSFCKPSGNP